MLFVVTRSGVSRVRLADEIDPAYAAAVREARRAGVEVLAYAAEMSPRRMRLAGVVEVDDCRTSVPVSGDEEETRRGFSAGRLHHR